MKMHHKGVLAESIRSYIQTALLGGREVGYDENLLLSGLLDSLAVASLVAELERIAGLAIPPQDVTIQHFVSIDAMVAYVVGAQE